MKLWHRLQAWFLLKRARRHHKKLQRYIHHTAHEICGWKQEIYFLESDAYRHLSLAGIHRELPKEEEESDKVVPIEGRATQGSASA